MSAVIWTPNSERQARERGEKKRSRVSRRKKREREKKVWPVMIDLSFGCGDVEVDGCYTCTGRRAEQWTHHHDHHQLTTSVEPEQKTHVPLNQFKASEGVGASKYSMALLSTIRSAKRMNEWRTVISQGKRRVTRDMLTISMNDAGRLWQRLHTQDCPEVDKTRRISAFTGITTEHEQIITQNADQRSGCQLGRKAFHLYDRGIALRRKRLERHHRLTHDPCQHQGSIHDKPSRRYRSHHIRRVPIIGLMTTVAYLCGCTRGLGNLPRILDCHCTSFRRDSDSRLPSFMLFASDEISTRALSTASSMNEYVGGMLRISSSNWKTVFGSRVKLSTDVKLTSKR